MTPSMLPNASMPPTRLCPTCYPKRLMLIKPIKRYRGGRPAKLIFECSTCGTLRKLPDILPAHNKMDAGYASTS
jgi:hypothetical protein